MDSRADRARVQAAFNGLYGLSQGSVRHDTINAKLERLGNLHEELILLIGAEKATQAIIEALARPEVSA